MTPFFLLFAEVNANLNADTAALPALAKHGIWGLTILLVSAFVAITLIYAVLVLAFHWLEIRRYERREIKRDTQLAAVRIEENDSRIKLAEAQTKLTDNVETLAKMIENTSERLNDNIKDVKVQVERLSDGMDDLKEVVEKHEKDITEHEKILQEYSADYQPQFNVKKRTTKRQK